jgi:hypothetical protein
MKKGSCDPSVTLIDRPLDRPMRCRRQEPHARLQLDTMASFVRDIRDDLCDDLDRYDHRDILLRFLEYCARVTLLVAASESTRVA